MKNLSLILLSLFICATVASQTPQAFKYQAVVRDGSGNILANKSVSFKITILSGSAAGSAVFSESHTGITTNAFGLIDLEIGRGAPLLGTFSSIPWGSNPFFLKVELDPAGGTAFQEMGTSQMLSVPYAIYAKEVQNREDDDADPANEIQVLQLTGTQLSLTKGGGQVTLPSAGGGDNWGVDYVRTDASLSGQGTTANPLKIAQQSASNGQVLKWNGTAWAPASDATGSGGSSPTGPAGGDLSGNYPDPLIGEGKVTSSKILDGTVSTPDLADFAITGAKIDNAAVSTDKLADAAVTASKFNPMGATTGQVLKWNGTVWGPGPDNEGGLTLPYSGTSTSGSPLFNIVNLGTSGAISTLSSGNYGIWGESSSTSGIGVYGVNKTSSGTTYGVFGDVYSSNGFSGFFQGGKFYVQGNAGIGTQNPSAKLEVNGQVKISGGTPGDGKVLTSDASGLASWQDPGPGFWLKNSSNIYYSSGNVGIGLNNPAGMMEIYGNSVDSYPTLLLSEADGYSRVSFRTMTASTKHWVFAGHTNPTEGDSQFHLNYNNGSGGQNLISVFGDSRINLNANVGIGTLYPTTDLEVAGQVKITGGNPGAGKVLTSDANGLASWATPTSSPWLTSGSNVYYNAGNVEIGQSVPRYKLTIYDDNDSKIGFYNSTSGTSGTDGFMIGTTASGSPVWIWNWENSNIHFGTDNQRRMDILGNGQVDIHGKLNINSNTPEGQALWVYGTEALWFNGTFFSWGYGANYNYFADPITIKSNSVPGYDLVVNGTAAKTGGGSWSNLSDARLKNILGNYTKGLDEIIALQPVKFKYREGNPRQLSSNDEQIGFIAQEVQQLFPEAVSQCKDGYLDFNMHSVNVAVVNAIKELKAENDLMKTENDQLKAENRLLNSRLEKVEELVGISAEK